MNGDNQERPQTATTNADDQGRRPTTTVHRKKRRRPMAIEYPSVPFGGLTLKDCEREFCRADFVEAVLTAARERLGQRGWEESVELVNEAGSVGFMKTRTGERWPLPIARSIDELLAKVDPKLIRRRPEEGDVFLQWSPVSKSFIKAGFIVNVDERRRYLNGRTHYPVDSIEAKSGHYGQTATRALLVRRDYCPANGDRVIRWVHLLPKDRER